MNEKYATKMAGKSFDHLIFLSFFGSFGVLPCNMLIHNFIFFLLPIVSFWFIVMIQKYKKSVFGHNTKPKRRNLPLHPRGGYDPGFSPLYLQQVE